MKTENLKAAVYAARGNARALEKIEEKLRLLLDLIHAFQQEARQSEWAQKNLNREVRP